ncbi:thioesterase II family protein [Actinoplanes palleronii]|uniref:Thioesterase n=1 Tax=Actinoplanes palleronii TaxID=113570 RepID=A0ABQ4BIW3_9ACTN|nr:alpha/beta fold hydrolase [Actinoplanes palleronii]GIE70619.1 thioesterase [Actinoplanes palleronii]
MTGSQAPADALLCVPFAGAGPSFFHPWRMLAAGHRRLVTVDLPGRERRILETPYRNVVEAARNSVDDLAAELAPGTRIVLFGHSLGAVLAYELVHLLSTRDLRVERLVVSGSPGPWTRRERRATGLPDEEFLARVEEFAGFRHEALDHPEMRELILPVLQADCEMHENYVPSTDEPVSVPITSLRGASDGLVSADQARQWQRATTAEFRYAEFPGDHMYLVDRAREVLDLIEAETARGRRPRDPDAPAHRSPTSRAGHPWQ